MSKIHEFVEKRSELYIERVNTDQDHIHIQIEIPPSISVASVVQKIKQITSVFLKSEFKFIREMYVGGVWSVGYFSSTVGLDEERIKKYIEHQGKKDLPNKEVSF